MWGNLGDSLAGLGDAITQKASAHAKQAHENQGTPSPTTATDEESSSNTQDSHNTDNSQQQQLPKWASNLTAAVSDKQNQKAALTSFRNWTNTVAENTKNIVNEAQRTLEKEQARIEIVRKQKLCVSHYTRSTQALGLFYHILGYEST